MGAGCTVEQGEILLFQNLPVLRCQFFGSRLRGMAMWPRRLLTSYEEQKFFIKKKNVRHVRNCYPARPANAKHE